MNNTFKLNLNNVTYEVYVELDKYESNNALSVNLIDAETNEVFDVISVNLPSAAIWLKEYEFFLDANNCPYAAKFLIENKIAKPTRGSCTVGHCRYPIYKLIGKAKRYKIFYQDCPILDNKGNIELFTKSEAQQYLDEVDILDKNNYTVEEILIW